LQFLDHLNALKAKVNGSNETGFDVEFNDIERTTEKLNGKQIFESALSAANKTKNRYSNVLPPEKTRVKITPLDDIEGSDYINASFITVHATQEEKYSYIATQGPLPNTINDFWKMIWEQGTEIIVMLTKEIENTKVGFAKVKCDRYWPDTTDRYGTIEVTVAEVEERNELIIRKFIIKNCLNNSDETRDILQLQYTAWPDHGLPPSTTEFLHLIALVNEANSHSPISVHCSAGIGRSGTFCAIHSTLETFKHSLKSSERVGGLDQEFSPPTDLIKSILELRDQRPGMVQTKEQYMFCYLAIQEGIVSSNMLWKS